MSKTDKGQAARVLENSKVWNAIDRTKITKSEYSEFLNAAITAVNVLDQKVPGWILMSERRPDFRDLSKVVTTLYLVDDHGKRFWVKTQTEVRQLKKHPKLYIYWFDEGDNPLPKVPK